MKIRKHNITQLLLLSTSVYGFGWDKNKHCSSETEGSGSLNNESSGDSEKAVSITDEFSSIMDSANNAGTCKTKDPFPLNLAPLTADARISELESTESDYKFSGDGSQKEEDANLIRQRNEPVNRESEIEENPAIANSNSFLINSPLKSQLKQNQDTLALLFSKVPLVTKYDALGKDAFIFNGIDDLQNFVDKSYRTAYEKSKLAKFGKNMDSIRPYIAYALAISWNIEFYQLNEEKLKNQTKSLIDLQVEVIKDTKVKITDNVKNYLGSVYQKGKASMVGMELRLVEMFFEEFVVEVRVWCVNSLGGTHQVVKNMQRAMDAVIKQTNYIEKAARSRTEKEREDYLEAVMYKKADMNHAIGLVIPTIQELMDGIVALKQTMDTTIMPVLKQAKKQTTTEIGQAKIWDQNHKLANNTIFQNLRKTNNWLKKNEKDMLRTEQKINVNALKLQQKIDDMRKAELEYLDYVNTTNEQIKRNDDERLQVFKIFDEDVKKYKKNLRTKQKSYECLNFGQDFLRRLRLCQRTTYSTTYQYYQSGQCYYRFYYCYRYPYYNSAYTAYTTTTSSYTWTDTNCYNKALEEQNQKALKPQCTAEKQLFQTDLETFNTRIKERLQIYEKRVESIDIKQKEMAATKIKWEGFRDKNLEHIERDRQQLLEDRSNLLIRQHNQVKGQDLGNVYKNNLEDNMEEFETYTDVLKLTRESLKEVDNALKRVSMNLNAFKVGLEDFMDMLKGQAKDFREIKRQVDKCSLKDTLNMAQKYRCKQITNAVLAKDHLEVLQKETLQAGLSSVVIGKMYNALYGFLTELKEHPVGLYNPDLTVKQNVMNFQAFVRRMNGQIDYFSDPEEINKYNDELKFINAKRLEKGLPEISFGEIEGIINVSK